MKLIVLGCVIAFAGSVLSVEPRRDESWPPPALLKLIQPVANICKPKTGVSDAAIKEFSDGEIHEDAALKCYMYCMFEEADLVSETGEVHLEKIATHVEMLDQEIQNIALNMGRRCLRPVGDDKCEKAFWFHKCWKTADPKHYFLI